MAPPVEAASCRINLGSSYASSGKVYLSCAFVLGPEFVYVPQLTMKLVVSASRDPADQRIVATKIIRAPYEELHCVPVSGECEVVLSVNAVVAELGHDIEAHYEDKVFAVRCSDDKYVVLSFFDHVKLKGASGGHLIVRDTSGRIAQLCPGSVVI